MKLEDLQEDYSELEKKYQDRMLKISEMQAEVNKLKRLAGSKGSSRGEEKRVTEFINMREVKDNAINFDVLSDEELAWVMLGLGVCENEVSYIDKDKDKIMNALAAWKRRLIEKEPDREGHVDMLKVAMWNSYISRVDYMRKLKLKKVVKGVSEQRPRSRPRSKYIKKEEPKTPDKLPGKRVPTLTKKPSASKLRRDSSKPEPKQPTTRKAIPIEGKKTNQEVVTKIETQT